MPTTGNREVHGTGKGIVIFAPEGEIMQIFWVRYVAFVFICLFSALTHTMSRSWSLKSSLLPFILLMAPWHAT